MPHQPTSAWSFQVTVPDERAARAVADELAARGHALVTVREVDWAHHDPDSFWYGKPSSRPDEQGQYDVTSLVTGPLPDDDERWWCAQEEQAVRDVAARHGGRAAGAGEGDRATMLSVFTRVGLVHELDDATVRLRREDAFTDTPARGPRTAPAEPGDTPPADRSGAPVPLRGVDDVDWASLQHAYGPAADVPGVLAGLAANDENWAEHLDDLIGSVTHQGSSYSATAPTLRLLAGLAAAPQLAAKRRLDLLYTLFLAGAAMDMATAHGYRPDPHHQQVKSTVLEVTPDLIGLWPDVSRPERRVLLLIAAIGPLPVPDHDLTDPAARLADTMTRDEAAAAAVLTELARSDEQLIQLDRATTGLHARLVAALEVLLLDG